MLEATALPAMPQTTAQLLHIFKMQAGAGTYYSAGLECSWSETKRLEQLLASYRYFLGLVLSSLRLSFSLKWKSKFRVAWHGVCFIELCPTSD